VRHLKHIVGRCKEFVNFNADSNISMSSKRAVMRLLTPYLKRNFLKNRVEKNQLIDRLINDGFSSITSYDEKSISYLHDAFIQFCSKHYNVSLTNLDSLESFLSKSEIQRTPAMYTQDESLLAELWNKEEHIGLAESYLGVNRSELHGVGSIDCLASVSQSKADDDLNALAWHRDVDHYQFLKIFYYLTDVGIDGGQHEYILGSHVQTPFSLAPIHRYKEGALEKSLINFKKISVSGPAGSGFAEDTFGFHRGTPIKKGIRLLMQFQYYSKSISWGNEVDTER